MEQQNHSVTRGTVFSSLQQKGFRSKWTTAFFMLNFRKAVPGTFKLTGSIFSNLDSDHNNKKKSIEIHCMNVLTPGKR